jgi:hypothetical protein
MAVELRMSVEELGEKRSSGPVWLSDEQQGLVGIDPPAPEQVFRADLDVAGWHTGLLMDPA